MKRIDDSWQRLGRKQQKKLQDLVSQAEALDGITTQFDIFVQHPYVPNLELFDQWVNGVSEEEAVQKQQAGQPSPKLLQLLKGRMGQHYRGFAMLEPLLQNPLLFETSHVFQVTEQQRSRLLESYFTLDSRLTKVLIGRTLDESRRKDLNPLQPSIPVTSLRRQFDNVRRIFLSVKRARHESKAGSLVAYLQQIWPFSAELAQQYVTMSFYCWHRFRVKRVPYLEIKQLIEISKILSDWTESPLSLDLSSNFKSKVRDMKTFLASEPTLEAALSRALLTTLTEAGLDPQKLERLEKEWPRIWKQILKTAVALSQPRDLRDLLSHLADNIVTPARLAKLSSREFALFMGSIITSLDSAKKFRSVTDKQSAQWRRYVDSLGRCASIMYKSVPI